MPVTICVNKCDLDPAEELTGIYTRAGFPVISVSAVTGPGDRGAAPAAGREAHGLHGQFRRGQEQHSQRSLPSLGLKTGEVSEKLGRGRHTTRHVELYRLDAGTYVADTPGFSSFDTDEMEVILKENLQYAFPDFGSCWGNASSTTAPTGRNRAAP